MASTYNTVRKLPQRLPPCRHHSSCRRGARGRTVAQRPPPRRLQLRSILGQCCEMSISFVQIPVGMAGSLLLVEKEYTVPMATTEECLVASTNRGYKAIHTSGGASSIVLRDAMTRAPVVRFSSTKCASKLKFYLEDPHNFNSLSIAFNK
ncbi:3-hydroxy-3-methylglutaryl-coenzyme A reductase 2-like [Cajanus cajan]|uniref:3-hydroxy-3-methylglutaryl-coenzyme A reductase 2-like n=1 Tax=Cajanus cajan TaxID=3821 RepID=UPI00098D93CD|nr:3-hydroxy-3-methylglutaryl-coenzyme A reductase 2-like [Cajanus cajan]